MAVIRVHKTEDYTVMSNSHLKDKRLSLKAKGLLSQVLSLPDSWHYTISGLVAINKENESAVKSALKELKNFGYLRIRKLMPNQTESGRIEYIYDIYEQPVEVQEEEVQEEEVQEEEKQGVDFQGVENQGQLNTNNKNTNNKIKNNKIKNICKIPPTLEEVKAYCEERKNNVDAQRFIDYYTSNGWKVGRNSMKDWKATVRNWEKSSYSSTKPAKERDDSLDDIF